MFKNKYPLGTMMRPHLAVELTNERIIWAGLKHFYRDFWSGFTIIYGKNYAFFSLFTKALPTYERPDGFMDGRTHLKSGENFALYFIGWFRLKTCHHILNSKETNCPSRRDLFSVPLKNNFYCHRTNFIALGLIISGSKITDVSEIQNAEGE